jgi:hypothetical protein
MALWPLMAATSCINPTNRVCTRYQHYELCSTVQRRRYFFNWAEKAVWNEICVHYIKGLKELMLLLT